MRQRTNDYLYHEFLEAHNQPLYFHQLDEQLETAGLQYLGEADVHLMMASTMPREVEEVLRRLATDLVHLQQYLDFLRNMPFRQSLLCHRETSLDRTRRPDVVRSVRIASTARP